jgi:hypothetical protein
MLVKLLPYCRLKLSGVTKLNIAASLGVLARTHSIVAFHCNPNPSIVDLKLIIVTFKVV